MAISPPRPKSLEIKLDLKIPITKISRATNALPGAFGRPGHRRGDISPMVTVRIAFAVTALLALAACSHTMATCSGPVYPLNQGKWTPSEQDLAVKS